MTWSAMVMRAAASHINPSRLVAVLTAGVLLALGAGCGSHTAAPLSDRQLAKLVLQPSDLPGLERFANAREVSSEQSPVLDGDPATFGRQGGWVARYRGSGAGKGPLQLASTVEMFDAADGAGKFFDELRKREAKIEAETGLTSVDVPSVGDEAYAYATPHARPGSIRAVIVTWRDGRFVATAFANGFAERMSVRDVLALVRRQDRRLANAR
jgi:hypothetical protein